MARIDGRAWVDVSAADSLFDRLQVREGWLVRRVAHGLCFVPDEGHEWAVGGLHHVNGTKVVKQQIHTYCDHDLTVQRLPVLGGWVVVADGKGAAFVPDANWEWVTGAEIRSGGGFYGGSKTARRQEAMDSTGTTWRFAVIGGWVVWADNDLGAVFIRDEYHEWSPGHGGQ